MALKVLPNDVRSLLCASAQINNYKTAVEELVYNSLDAESTSIAIRVHIQENRIQVIDNGCGIAKIDYEALGQRYMTSKYADTSTLKSIPRYYGYRGEFLANIIEISRNVKIISRYKDDEETWAKTFHEGKIKSITKMTTRPSKGTTVEIRGFLYNLHIQSIAIDPINDLQNIKTFLEQLCLVHADISLSLRDDSKNDIMFKVHKKRDIYQTLNILFNIERSTVQELQVEKNEYKVKAFIGKTDIEIGKHWIYLNGRYIQNNSKLHEVINEYLKKYLLINDKKKTKSKHNHDEYHLFKQKIPFYFLFIACPYMDYDISMRQLIEFKNWEQIKKMLEKLVKFYIGDVRLKEINKIDHKVVVPRESNKDNENHQDKIKNIISKILGNSKKLGVSELRNGVKGKLVKRKKLSEKKNRRTSENITHKKLSRQQEIHIDIRNEQQKTSSDSLHKYKDNPIIENITNNNLPQNKVTTPDFDKNTKTNYVKTSKTKKNKNKKQKKMKVMSPVIRHTNMKTTKSKIKPTKTNKIKDRGYYLNAIKFLTKTDSVQLKSRIVAQEAEDFLRRQNIYNIMRKNCTENRKDEENLFARNNYTTRTNNMKYCVDSKIRYKLKANPFKTTYDLVQTIFENQGEGEFDPTNKSSYSGIKYFPVRERLQTSKFTNVTKRPWIPRFEINEVLSNYTNIESGSGQYSNYDFKSKDQSFYKLTYENNSSSKYTELEYRYNNINNNTVIESTQRSLRCEDLLQDSDMLQTQHETSRHFSYTPAASLLTYESHQYGKKLLDSNNLRNDVKSYRAHSTRFISKESRDNFVTKKNNYSHTMKHISKPTHIKEINKRMASKNFIKHIVNESCTIEFTKSSKINCPVLVSEQSNLVYTNDYTQHTYQIHTPSYEPTSGFGNTYTIPIYCISSDCNNSCNQNQTRNNKVNEFSATYSVVFANAKEQKWQTSATSSENMNNTEFIESNEPFGTNSVFYANAEAKNREPSTTVTKNNNNKEEDNIVFVSKPQNSDAQMIVNEVIEDIEPMNVCETVLSAENESIINEFAFSFNLNKTLNDSLYRNSDEINHDVDFNAKYKTQIITAHSNEDISHHFRNTLTTRDQNVIDTIHRNTQERDTLNVKAVEKDIGSKNEPQKENNFSFKDRLRFLPKGMSQIFENCGSKNVCDYNLDQDYYEDTLYNDFANDVQMQTEVYEPAIQNVEDLTTKDIQKFKSKVQNDNASLVFDEQSLKSAKILNQVDCKFIATIMKEKRRNSVNTSEYLVLFDQHAVHERIKLEQNLLDYIKEDTWKSVVLDNNITLKTNQDEILYLHNYKDKFVQLGLQWTIMNKDEVSISSIPEAILGKNPREVDKIIKAVKSLIVEEINVIKLQKGNISLYPKSIMDLVFSEACRYAIKFGDALSKTDCVELLKDLSNCKTPFQCAHGRPVMAVLVDYKSDISADYKINMDSLLRFKLNNKPVNTN